MSKIIHIVILVSFLSIAFYIASNYLLNYINFFFYHFSLGIHIFFSKFLAETTVSFIHTSFLGIVLLIFVFFFINLIKD